MAKEINGIDKKNMESMSLKEFLLQTGLTTDECTFDKISLETELYEGVNLQFPFIPAAMRSVTGYEMALECAKNGMMAVIPCSMPIKEEVKIIKDVKSKEVKKGEIEFVENPLTARPDDKFSYVLETKIKRYGHSTIPVIDKFGRYLGTFIYTEPENFDMNNPMEKLIQYQNRKKDLDFCLDSDDYEKIKKQLKKNGRRFMPIVDEQGHLIKLAFIRKIPSYLVAAGIDTHKEWERRAYPCVESGADMIFADSSDGYNVFQGKLIEKFKKRYPHIPFSGGNIITKEGFYYLADCGADVVKIGMGIGSICTTSVVKGVGRGQATALIEIVDARNEYYVRKGRYIPLIADGSIEGTHEMIIALSIGADALMLGRYFNRFYEAAGQALDKEKRATNDEEHICYKETWGEGSPKAMSYRRYGHKTARTAFAEGVVGMVDYAGRLKPNVERDALIIKSSMSNAGCRNLKELREKAILERMSPASTRDAYPHGLVEYMR